MTTGFYPSHNIVVQAVDKMQKTHAEHMHSMSERLAARQWLVFTVPISTPQLPSNVMLLRLAHCTVLDRHVKIYEQHQ